MIADDGVVAMCRHVPARTPTRRSRIVDHETEDIGKAQRRPSQDRRLRAVEHRSEPVVPAVGEDTTIGRLIARTALIADGAVVRHQRELPRLRSRWGRWR